MYGYLSESSRDQRKSKPLIIALLGTVGSGKSTHQRLLTKQFRRNNIKVKSVPTLKTNHFFSRIFVYFLEKLLIKKKDNVYPIKAVIDEKPLVFKKLFRLWLLLDIFSLSIQFLLTIYLRLRIGYLIIVEEYIPAAIADYLYIGHAISSSRTTFSFATNFLLKLMYTAPAQLIFLDADTRTLTIRWKQRGSPKEYLDYLHMQRTTLLGLSKKLTLKNLIYINTTNQTVKKTHQLMLKQLNEIFLFTLRE